MASDRNGKRGLSIALAAAGLLAACSEVQIDVDVYKGPLANHIDVQTEQIAVMAVGAEPLLVRLEREMCDLAYHSQHCRQFYLKYRNEESLRNNIEEELLVKVKSGQVPPETEIGCPEKRKDHCYLYENVRGVRSLYFDLGKIVKAQLANLDPQSQRDLEQRLEFVGEQLEKAQGSVAILDPQSNEARKHVIKIRPLLDRLEVVDRTQNRSLGSLASGYRNFLNPPLTRFREWKPILNAIDALQDVEDEQRRLMLGGGSEFALPVSTERQSGASQNERQPNPSSNRMFAILSDHGSLRAQAKVLFEGDPETQENFTTEVRRVSLSFMETREAMNAALTATLKLIRDFGPRLKESSPDESVPGEEVLEPLAIVASDLMQTHHVTAALTAANADQAVRDLADRLAKAIEIYDGDPASVNPFRKKHEKDAQRALRRAIAQLLFSTPEATASALLSAQELFISPSFQLGTTGRPFVAAFPGVQPLDEEEVATLAARDDHFQKERLRRMYGLSRMLLNEDHSENLFSKNWISEAKSLISRAATSLGGISEAFLRGRGKRGLYSLTEAYLWTSAEERASCSAVTPCETGKTQSEINRRLLHDAMVQFAHRVLFVVNHESLFVTKIRVSEAGSVSETQKYIRVLQTVGNSILTHIDAMRQELAHGDMLEQATAREASAVRQVFGGGPGDIFNRILDSLKDDLEIRSRRVADLEADHARCEIELAPLKVAFMSADETLKEAREIESSTSGADESEDAALTSLETALRVLTEDEAVLEGIKKKAEDTTNVSPDQLLDAIIEVLTTLKSAATIDTSRESRSQLARDLQTAISVIDDASFKDSVTPAPAGTTNEEQHRRILEELKKRRLAMREKVQIANEPLTEARAKTQQAQDQYDKAKKAYEEKRKECDGLTTRIQQAATPRTAAADAVTKVASYRAAVLKAVRTPSSQPPFGEAIKAQLESLLAADSSTAGQNALAAVGRLAPPTETPMNLGVDEEGADAKTVLDAMIAVLRYEHLRAQKDRDKDSQDISKAAAALAESYRQRADMIYLRPAMAYLRTSFTATTLQDNRLAWRNMLSRHGLRSGIPFIPGLREKYDPNNQVVAEIDKQFWHNINRVRVTGAGDTNYAIAKDDVGNWYIKGYSTKVDKIVKSAKSLAVFAAGGTVPLEPSAPVEVPVEASQLTGQGGSGQGSPRVNGQGQQDDDEPASEGEQKRLSKQHGLFADRFVANSVSGLRDAKSTAQTFEANLQAAWKQSFADSEAKQGRLNPLAAPTEQERLKTELLDLDIDKMEMETPEKAPEHLAQGLRAIKLYHDRVVSAIYRLPEKANESDENPFTQADRLRAARAVTDTILKIELRRLVGAAAQSAREYETALEIIGQTAGQ